METPQESTEINNPINTETSSIPNETLKEFQSLGLHSSFIHQLYTKLNITQPTPIQKAVFSKLFLPSSFATNKTKTKTRSFHSNSTQTTTSFTLNLTNAFIQSETGSGKTLCYLLPILQTLLFPPSSFSSSTNLTTTNISSDSSANRSLGPLALILVPTRELAVQIHHTLELLLNFPKSNRCCSHWLVTGTLMGGDKKKSEKQRLRKGLNIIISTPGRFLDHLTSTNCLQLNQMKWIVLDEADRLLDMGFQKALFSIFEALEAAPLVNHAPLNKNQNPSNDSSLNSPFPWFQPSSRLVYLCSATIHEKYKVLVNKGILKQPILNINIHSNALESNETTFFNLETKEKKNTQHSSLNSNDSSNASTLKDEFQSTSPKHLHHQYLVVPLKYKLWALLTFLKYIKTKKILIFFCTKASVQYMHCVIAKFFPHRPCFLLHGDLSQSERKSNLLAFHSHTYTKHTTTPSMDSDPGAAILLATDVAARGLDIPHIDYTCQFDPPMDPMEYVHRAGRTARAGQSGTSLLFLVEHELEFATRILPSHQLHLTSFSLPLLMQETWHSKAWEVTLKKKFQFPLEQWVSRHPEFKTCSMNAFRSHIQSYATYPLSLKHIFHLKKLHLGHLATMYGFLDPPTQLLVSSVQTHSSSSISSSLLKKTHFSMESHEDSLQKDDNTNELLSQENKKLLKRKAYLVQDMNEFQIFSNAKGQSQLNSIENESKSMSSFNKLESNGSKKRKPLSINFKTDLKV